MSTALQRAASLFPSNVINEMLNDPFFSDFDLLLSPKRERSLLGAKPTILCDMKETPTEYWLFMELPGVDKKDIKLEVSNNILNIQGCMKPHELKKDESWVMQERLTGDCSRRIRLPENCDFNKIKAEMHNGILKVCVPKKEEAKPKSITVE